MLRLGLSSFVRACFSNASFSVLEPGKGCQHPHPCGFGVGLCLRVLQAASGIPHMASEPSYSSSMNIISRRISCHAMKNGTADSKRAQAVQLDRASLDSYTFSCHQSHAHSLAMACTAEGTTHPPAWFCMSAAHSPPIVKTNFLSKKHA